MGKNKATDQEDDVTRSSGNETQTDYTKAEMNTETPIGNYEESLEVTTAKAGTATETLNEKRDIDGDKDGDKVPGKTATDYSKVEKEANSTPAGNYEEPLKVATTTADTSVEALDEKREIEKTPETKKPAGETGE